MPRDRTWEVSALCGSELRTNECEDLWVAPAGTPHLSISLRSSHFSPSALRKSGFKAACEAGCAAMHSGKAHEPPAWKGSVCSELKGNSLECGCSLMSVTFLELCSSQRAPERATTETPAQTTYTDGDRAGFNPMPGSNFFFQRTNIVTDL